MTMMNLGLWILLFPLLGFVILGLLGKVLPKPAVITIALVACGMAFLLTLTNFFSLMGMPEKSQVSDQILFSWMSVGNQGPLPFQVSFGVYLDALSLTMLLVVTGVGFLIHVYSIGYMEEDLGFARFFAYLNFFIFAMVLLIAADNFLFLLVGWGLVGLASFLLIGFWYQKRSAVAAAQKAFVINIIGDFGLMIAIFLIFLTTHVIDFQTVFGADHLKMIEQAGGGTALAIALLLFLACAAKSAQLPLYMWLPDAMEGPTPVSALIHAATMVTAGVYLVARTHPMFELAPASLNVVAGIGGATALFAAVIALTQLDIKRVLAYSTISQLGYMFMAEGVANYSAGIFHVLTHAFFKALLFLGAGAVIHALAGQQDMRQMGGLRKRVPITFITFLIGALAISGIPPFAGFWSKDEILVSLLQHAVDTGNAWFYALWGLGLLTAGLTAFYMFRLTFNIFFGTYRGPSHSVEVHHDDDEVQGEEEASGHHGTVKLGFYDIFEVSPVMYIPLIILALFSIFAGFWGSLSLIGVPGWAPLPHLLEPVLHSEHQVSGSLAWISAGVSVLFGGLGILFAWLKYRKGFEYKESKNFFYRLSFNKFYVDEALNWILIKPIYALGRGINYVIEGGLLDNGSRGLGWTVRGVGSLLRGVQTGFMRNYALAIMIGVIVIVVYIAVRG